METEHAYKLGALEAKTVALQADVAEIKGDQKSQNAKLDILVADLNKRRGAKAALVGMSSLAGALGAAVAWVVEHVVAGR